MKRKIGALAMTIGCMVLAGCGQAHDTRKIEEVHESESGLTITLLRMGIDEYHLAHGEYPPSEPVVIGGTLFQGRHRLAQELLGYLPDADADAAPAKAEAIVDDGKEGLGVRTRAGGPVQGPFVNYRELQIRTEPDGKRKYFVDSHGNPVYYYRFDPAQGRYHKHHNLSGPDIDRYARKADGTHFRQSYLLITRGKDGVWTAYASDTNTDDLTNFLPGS